ncbi:hypothetical protein IMZ48_35295, partial [Candidatus Bathyarchaeota archaeon]|nr:hypothetical protein [Candidatus Bathyarchaeota archaeon]
MRLGRVSDGTVKAFQLLARPLRFTDGVEATELFPTRMEVERSNLKRLNALPGKSYRFDAADTGDPKIKDRLLQNMMAPKMIDLKVGAQVMLIKNLDEYLCNGTTGTIMQFSTEAEWANQGGGDGTTEDAPVDLDRAIKKLKKFAHNPGDTSRVGVPFPIVQFTCADGSFRTLQCVTDEWKVELPNGEVQAKRSQVPLILAWALSIHKAQGQTLERVKVDLTRTFEKGQAYVALSRATSQQGLQVLKFDKGKVMAHPRVVQFYNQLYSADDALKRKAVKADPAVAVKGEAAWGGKGKQKQKTLQGMFKSEDPEYYVEKPDIQALMDEAEDPNFGGEWYEDHM